MASRLFNLLALSTIAVLLCSFGPTPATALSVDKHFARHPVHAHEAVAKRKRGEGKHCKPRPTSTKASAPTPAPHDENSNSNNHNGSGSGTTSVKPSSTPKTDGGNNSSGGSGNTGGSSVQIGGGSGKVGLAWPNGDDPNLSKFVTSKVKYIYTWSPSIPSKAKSLGLRPMPMLWGDNQIDEFTRLVKPGYADIVLGMNEPNQAGQAQMSPEHGVELWLQYINPLKDQGYYLISPATTSAPSGKQWMKDFFRICNGRCHVDAVAAHYYDVSAQGFIDYMTDFHNTFNLPIWPTEFACQNFNGGKQCSDGEVRSFMGTITSWMDKTDWIGGYMAFGVMHDMQNVNPLNQLMGSNGGPTSLGFQYINA